MVKLVKILGYNEKLEQHVKEKSHSILAMVKPKEV